MLSVSCRRIRQDNPSAATLRQSVARQARTFFDLLEADTGVLRDCLPAVMDDRLAGEREPWGLTEVGLVVVVEVATEGTGQACNLTPSQAEFSNTGQTNPSIDPITPVLTLTLQVLTMTL